MKSPRAATALITITLAVLLHEPVFAQERPSLLAGHGQRLHRRSILPLWVGADAKLFDKHGYPGQADLLAACRRPAGAACRRHPGLFLRRPAAGADALGRRRRRGGVLRGAQADLEDHGRARHSEKPPICAAKYLPWPTPGSASDFAAKLFLARQGLKPGQDVSLIYSGSTSAAFAALVNGRVQAIFTTAPNDLQAAAAGFKSLLELGDLNIPYIGNCSAAMRPYIAKQPGRVRAFVAGITEAIAYIHRRPNEAKAGWKNTLEFPTQPFYNTPMTRTPVSWSRCRVRVSKAPRPSSNTWESPAGPPISLS